jgi:hypothetical protein
VTLRVSCADKANAEHSNDDAEGKNLKSGRISLRLGRQRVVLILANSSGLTARWCCLRAGIFTRNPR